MNYFKYIQNGFHRYLFISNTISSGVLMSIGDLIEQRHEIMSAKHCTIDWPRNFRMTLVGFGMGVINHHYYKWIDRTINQSTVKHSFLKVVADQLIASPMCITFLFYFDGIMLSQSLQQIHADLREKFLAIFTADCCFWPPLQYINFRYVDKQYRVIYLNTIQMFYNIFLSHVKYKKKSLDPEHTSIETEKIRTRFVSLEGYMEGYHNHGS